MTDPLRHHNDLGRLAHYPIPERAIATALGIYRPDHRYVVSALRSNYTVYARVRLDEYAATYPGILTYVTASQLMTLVSQVGYLLIHELAAAGLAPLDSSEFLRAQRGGEIVFTRFKNMRFRRKVWHSELEVSLVLGCERFAKHGRLIAGHVTFAFDTSAIRGTSTVAITLPPER